MVRSFPLRTLAFLRGGGQASSCLRGLARPPIPLESTALRSNPLCAWGVVSGRGLVVIKVVSSSFDAVVGMDRSFPLWALAFLRGGGQASSCLRGLARPPIPLESSALRSSPLCALGVVSGLRMVVIIIVSSSFDAVVWNGSFLSAAGACFPAGRWSSLLVPAGSCPTSYSAGVNRPPLQSTLCLWIGEWP